MSDSYGVTATFSARDNISSAIAQMRSRIRGMSEDTNQVTASLGEMAKGTAVFSLISKGIGEMTSSLDGAISRFDTLQNFPRIMKIMGSPIKESTSAINMLKKGVDGLPTALDTVASTTEKLYPAVGNNVNKAAKSTLALNDAFIASGASAEDASRGLIQYTQMLSTGKVDMMSWRSLEETMPYALQKVAKSFGIASGSMQDLYSKVQSGQISMKQLNDRFIELDQGATGFHEAALNATAGIGTAVANMKNRVKAGLADIIEDIDNTIKKATGVDLAGWINKSSSKIKENFDALGNQIKGSVATIRNIFNILRDAIMQIFPAWKSAIESVVQSYGLLYAQNDKAAALNTFRAIVQQITQALVGLANFIQQNSTKVAALISIVLRATTAFLAFKTAINISNTIAQPFLGLAGGISTATARLTQFFGIGTQFQTFGTRILAVSNNIKTMGPAGETAKNAISEAVAIIDKLGTKSNASTTAINKARNAISLLGKQDQTTARELSNLLTKIEESSTKSTESISGINALSNSLNPLRNRLNLVKEEFNKLGPNVEKSTAQVRNIGPSLLSAGSSMQMAARTVVSRIVSIFKTMGTRIKVSFSSLRSIGPMLLSVFQNPIAAITSGLGRVLGVARTFGASLTVALGPVGIVLAAITAAVVAFTVMWKNNFMNIRGVVSSFVSGISQSFSSMQSTVSPIINALKVVLEALKPVLQGIAVIIGGALMAALSAVMLVVAGAIDTIRTVITGISTIVIAIKALITAIAKGGEAIGKFFKGDFKGAAESAKGSVGAIKDGISDIGKQWQNLANNSATAKTVNALKQVGKSTDDDAEKAKDFQKAWSEASKSMQNDNKANKESFDQVVESMKSAFGSDDGMKGYVSTSETLLKSWSSKQQEIQKKSSALMEQATKESGENQRKLRAAAINEMLSDQSKGADQMQQIMNDNNKMLQSGVASNGQKLTDEQKQALKDQNEAVAQALIDQSNMELRAFRLKIDNHEKWTKEDTTRQIAAIKQQNNALYSEHEANAQREKDLEQKLANAKTETEKNGYQMQLDALKQSDQKKLQEIDSNNIQIIESMARSGQLTHKTFIQALNKMKISTTQGLEEMLSEVNQHSATMWERMQVMAQYFGTAGKQGTQNFLNAVASGDLEKAGNLMNNQVMRDLGKLPAKMFKGGSDGKQSFLDAIKRGNYEAAGENISDKVDKGLSKRKGGGKGKGANDEGTKRAKEISNGLSSQAPNVQKSAKKVSDAADKGLKANTAKAKSEGKKTATAYSSGVKSGKSSVSSASKELPKAAASGAKSSTGSIKSAGKSVSNSYASGVRSGKESAHSAGASLGSSAVSGLNSKKSSAKSAGTTLGSSMQNGLKSKSSAMRSTGKDLGSSANSGARTYHSDMYSTGKYLAEGIAEGITSGSGAIRRAAESAVQKAVAAARRKADINSPSRVMKLEVGQWLAKGIASGIDEYTEDAQKSAQDLIGRVRSTLSGEAGFILDTRSQLSVSPNNQLLGLIANISSKLDRKQQIVMDTGALVGSTADVYNQKFGSDISLNERFSK